MTPLLSLWPSAKTAPLESKISAILNRDFNVDDSYQSKGCDDVSTTISKAYRDLIRLTDIDTTLHVVAVVTLEDSDVIESISDLVEALKASTNRVSFHLIGLALTSEKIFGGASDSDSHICSNDVISEICKISENKGFNFSITLVEDYVSSGAPLKFSLDSLSWWFATLFYGLMMDYYQILPVFPNGTDRPNNLSIGISSIEFNKQIAADYLLHHAFLASLDGAGICTEEVDIQHAKTKADQKLQGMDKRYNNFLENIVMPQFRDGNGTPDLITANILRPLDKEMSDIASIIKTILTDKDVSFPEREAVLAMILGRDNKHLRGVQFDTEHPMLDDIVAEAVEQYVDAFNQWCPESGVLPLRGDYKALRILNFDPETGKLKDDERNHRAFSPLKDIKCLKKDILDETSFIRRKNDELQQLETSDTERRLVEEGLTDNGFRGHKVVNEIKERPLNDKYVPSPSLKPLSSVDLRKFFSPVKDQGQIGACSTYATVAMYEAIMNRGSSTASELADMSEGFLYYYTNILNGNPDGGSNFYDQLAVLVDKGICEEALYTDSSHDMNTAPNEVAIENAKLHRVIKALQIPLVEDGSKASVLKQNHKLLTSALTEGYSIGIALRILPGFGTSTFVNRPTGEELNASDQEYHAMVLVGYSDEDKYYIVRNSWGKDFGDNGYCYISAAYIDDPQFNKFACIITQTTDSDNSHSEIPQVVAGFGGTQSQIKMAVIHNILDEAQVRLDSNMEIYKETYEYYQKLFNQLCVPGVRKTLTKAAEEAAKVEYLGECQRFDDLQNAFVPKFKEFKRKYKYDALRVSAIGLGLDIISAMFLKFGLSGNFFVGFYIVSALATIFAVCMWVHYKWAKRKERAKLQKELDESAHRKAVAFRKLQELQLRFHFAGMWIDRYSALSIELTSLYDRLVSYNDNLKNWYKEESLGLSRSIHERGDLTIALEDPDLLLKHFNKHSDVILANLNLIDAFNNYSVNQKSISDVKEKLNNDTRNAILKIFDNFRIVDYLLGNKEYPYVESPNMSEIIGKLLMIGQPTWRYRGIEADEPSFKMLFMHDDSDIEALRNKTNRYFQSVPSLKRAEDPSSLLLISTRLVPIDIE